MKMKHPNAGRGEVAENEDDDDDDDDDDDVYYFSKHFAPAK
jgi:hypothetical protein